MLQQERTKRVKYYYLDFQLNTPLSFFLKGGYIKNWVGRQFLQGLWGETETGEEMQRSQGGWDFFSFIFLLLAIIVTDIPFRKPSLGNLF